MGCNCGGRKAVTHQVTRPDGTTKSYGTAAEAKAAATASGGSYERIEH
ncbi:hypothetical protein SAMN05421642_103394 [Rhodococcoides kyotonense]|uniref:Uncharacterized protein n=1 Tax=Rhodococcoides kyotonense TaxID=398843 RepID=A0A239FS77_9NOCA|nr:hypothetical protein SAMN05421642_103394 [Rhodococcus kyotonensis]